MARRRFLDLTRSRTVHGSLNRAFKACTPKDGFSLPALASTGAKPMGFSNPGPGIKLGFAGHFRAMSLPSSILDVRAPVLIHVPTATTALTGVSPVLAVPAERASQWFLAKRRGNVSRPLLAR